MKRKGSKYILPVAKFAKTALDTYVKYHKGTQTYDYTRKKSNGGQRGVTNQYDRTTVYSKKRMPYKKRRRWSRFIKKVNAVSDKSLVTHTFLKNSSLTPTISAPNINLKQMYGIVHLYGWAGTDLSNIEVGTGDIATLVNHDDQTTGPLRKFRFSSGVMDCTLTNSGDYTLEVDVYYVVNNKSTNQTSYRNELFTAESDMVTPTPISGTNAKITLADRGATPFDFVELGKKGYKIIRKTKYILSPNQVATFQYRDAKNRYCTSAWSFGTSHIWRNCTKTWVIVAKPVPGATDANTIKMDIGVTRNYSYKLLDGGNIERGYIPS